MLECVSADAKIPIVPVEFSPPLDVVNRNSLRMERFRDLLRGKDVQELRELQRQGISIQAISELTGWDRKTIRKYMQAAGVVPEYGPRAAQPSKLDAFKPYLEERLRAGVWNARVLLRELRERNYAGSYTILTDWLRPQRSATRGHREIHAAQENRAGLPLKVGVVRVAHVVMSNGRWFF